MANWVLVTKVWIFRNLYLKIYLKPMESGEYSDTDHNIYILIKAKACIVYLCLVYNLTLK